MSAWKLTVRELYEKGGSAHKRHLYNSTKVGLFYAHHVYKLIETNGYGTWSLTQLGSDWCEGRVIDIQGKHPADLLPQRRPQKKIRFVATWLSSLPRDIRQT